MQERHTNREVYLNEQITTSEKYVIPFIEQHKAIDANCEILEIGCGEGGNLLPFATRNCKRIVGIDLSETKIENAKRMCATHLNGGTIHFLAEDIYKVSDIGQFDVIMMRDVIEHIHNQERFMQFVKQFLKPKGAFFLGFPPWQNPFGGHQQICQSPLLSKLPYFHLMPRWCYQKTLGLFGETEETTEALLEIKMTGISIERFEKILQKERYKTEAKTHYFINPNYETKFGLRPRVAWRWVAKTPYLRNFFTTACYYLVSVE